MQNSINVSDNDTKNLTVLSRQNVLDKDFTVYGSVENPLFLAKDVAEWIDYAKTSKGAYNVSMMLNSIDEDEKLVSTILVSGQNRECSFVTENGLYEILMLSRKPIAKQFKKEVKKILHQIRTTGGYTVPRTFADALRLAAEQQERIALMQPKADVYDDLVDRSKTLNFRDMAAKLGMSQNEFMTILKAKYIYKNTIGEYRAYSEYQNLFSLRTYAKGVDQTGEQLLLNMEGITYFCKKYKPGAIAESFIEKSEKEYQKIIDKTATNYVMKAIENCPESKNSYVDNIKSYTFDQVAKASNQTVETIKNFCKLQNYVDENCKPNYFSIEIHKYMLPNGKFTKTGKDRIVAAFYTIENAEKGMKSSSLGKAE